MRRWRWKEKKEGGGRERRKSSRKNRERERKQPAAWGGWELAKVRLQSINSREKTGEVSLIGQYIR